MLLHVSTTQLCSLSQADRPLTSSHLVARLSIIGSTNWRRGAVGERGELCSLDRIPGPGVSRKDSDANIPPWANLIHRLRHRAVIFLDGKLDKFCHRLKPPRPLSLLI